MEVPRWVPASSPSASVAALVRGAYPNCIRAFHLSCTALPVVGARVYQFLEAPSLFLTHLIGRAIKSCQLHCLTSLYDSSYYEYQKRSAHFLIMPVRVGGSSCPIVELE